MTSDEAAQILGLTPSRSYEAADVRRAFGSVARGHHPDTNPDMDGPRKSMATLQKARDVLLALTTPASDCPLCKGAGKVRVTGKLTLTDCPRGCSAD